MIPSLTPFYSFTPDVSRQPLATAIVIVHDTPSAAERVVATIESVVAQTSGAPEIVVINTATEPLEIERAISPLRRHIAYQRRGGVTHAAARNAGLDLACGRFIGFLDAGECWAPDFLARVLATFDGDAALDLVYADARMCDGGRFMERHPSSGAPTFDSLLAGQCVVCRPAALIRASRLREVGALDVRLQAADDFDLWLRLLLDGARATYLRDPLASGVSAPASSNATLEGALLTLLGKHAQLPSLTSTQRRLIEHARRQAWSAIELSLAKRDLEERRYDGAAEAVARANRCFRSVKLALIVLALRVAPGLVYALNELRRRQPALP